MLTVVDKMKKRGLIQECTQGVEDIPQTDVVTVYAGFDPTADSLHVGNLAVIMALSHFQRAGHKVLVVVGGATGMVGDPSGKSEERKLLGPDEVSRNASCLKAQLSRFLSFEGDNPAVMLDNNDWISPMSFIDWLREVGKHFTVNSMLAKKSVAARIQSTEGISFTEFSYMTMQAFDFYHLFNEFNCTIQIGGNDQYGNITAGIELLRKRCGKRAYGITIPLITTASGRKFGKSEGNAIWLDPRKTSPFHFYQFWINTSDQDVERFLCLFTFLDIAFIKEVIEQHIKEPEKRLAQRLLAREVTGLVHGVKQMKGAELLTKILYQDDVPIIRDDQLEGLSQFVPVSTIEANPGPLDVVTLVHQAKVTASKSEARRLIRQGGISINRKRIANERDTLCPEDTSKGRVIIIGRGKNRYHLVRFT